MRRTTQKYGSSKMTWKQQLKIALIFLRRRFIEINKQYIQDSRKERHTEHSEKN